MIPRVLVVGAPGKMGRLAVETIAEAPDFELAGTAGRGEDLLALLDEVQPQIWIDMTTPEVGGDHLDLAVERGIHPVFGTTGIDRERLARAGGVAEERSLGGVIAPNFSLGACLLMELSEMVARQLPEVEIIEAHHPQKKDAPSGTSLRTRDRLLQNREGAAAAPESIPIHSVRLPGFLATQEVIFGGAGERLILRHETLDRRCFAAGILLACRRVSALPGLIFDLAPLLFGDSDRSLGRTR